MSKQKYIETLRAFCASAGIKEVDTVLASGNLNVNGVAFTLRPPPESDPDALRILCDYGLAPARSEAAIYRRLLEVSLLTCADSCFVRNPENGHVLLYFSLRLSDGDAVSLRTCLELCADEALKWRKSYYLDKGEQLGFVKQGSTQTALLQQLGQQASK